MNEKTYTDEQIIEMIRLSGAERKKALHFVYVDWYGIASSVLRKSRADDNDIKDAIQGAIIVLDNNIRSGQYEQKGSLRNYFIGICRGKLYSNRRSTRRIEWTDDDFKMDGIETQNPGTLMLEEEEKAIVEKMLDQMGEKCKKILELYRLSYSREEIAKELGITNANNVRQKIFKCRQKMTELVSQSPFFQNYFSH